MAAVAVTVLGGGVAGLSTALLLARQGHPVVLIERDRFDDSPAVDAPTWERRGIPHFLQPHAFIPRARSELRTHLPDVYSALLAAGATEIDGRKKMPGGNGDDDRADEELQYVAARRPLIEWALRRAVDGEDIEVRDGVTIDGLQVDGGRITGVGVDGGVHPATVVVDALGRRTPTQRWLAEAGIATTPIETSDCGVVYYSRYYRTTNGFELPDGPWVLSPRGDLGYLGWATFPGDNGTFAALLSVPSGVPEWRALSDESAFEAAAAGIPGLRQWVDPEGVDAITAVMPMAGLANSFRRAETAAGAGLAPVGDAHSHTDPVLAHGLAFAFVQAAELAGALANSADPIAGLASYVEAVAPSLRERFDLASSLDDQRHRLWMGEPVDFTRRTGAYALFSLVAGGAASSMDPAVFRMYLRRMGLLDSTSVLDDDPIMQSRIEELFAQAMQTSRPPAGPPRDEMLATVSAARRRPG